MLHLEPFASSLLQCIIATHMMYMMMLISIVMLMSVLILTSVLILERLVILASLVASYSILDYFEQQATGTQV